MALLLKLALLPWLLLVIAACRSWRWFAAMAALAILLPSGLLAYFSHAMAQPGYDDSAGDALGLALLFIASCAGLIASVLAVPVAWMLRRGWRRRPQRWPASTWDDDEWHGPSP